jgi:hypothetical protein
MSEKVVRCVASTFWFEGGGEGVTISEDMRGTFDDGDEVVVIPASEYERLIALPQKIATAMKTCEDMNDFAWQVTALVKEG